MRVRGCILPPGWLPRRASSRCRPKGMCRRSGASTWRQHPVRTRARAGHVRSRHGQNEPTRCATSSPRTGRLQMQSCADCPPHTRWCEARDPGLTRDGAHMSGTGGSAPSDAPCGCVSRARFAPACSWRAQQRPGSRSRGSLHVECSCWIAWITPKVHEDQGGWPSRGVVSL